MRWGFLVFGVGLMALFGATGKSKYPFAQPISQQAAPHTPYASWRHGPPATSNYFPIAVWLQDPANAPKFKAAGFNLYVGLWQGPTEEQLAALKAAQMPVICAQNAVGLAHKEDPIIVGWMHDDEPDNAQPVVDPTTGKQTWGPCVPPDHIVAEYEKFRTADPTRPIMLNLGQGVANDAWYGRGPGAKLSDYETYVKGCDIVSFDVYPVAGLNNENDLWYVAKGVERLVHWTQGKKIVWNCIECTRIDGEGKPTPHEVRAEVWMALIHGSQGLIYFVHQFKPTFDEHALLDDPPMLAAVTQINQQIHQLAPVLNSPTIEGDVQVVSSSATVPVDVMEKRYHGAIYLFAVGMRNGPTHATFTIKPIPKNAVAEVLGENRTILVTNGKFEDSFQPYDVHLYRITVPR